MKPNQMKRKLLAGALCSLLMANTLTGCSTSTAAKESMKTDEPTSGYTSALKNINFQVKETRANYQNLASELQALYQNNPKDVAVALAYAEKLIQLGDVDSAREAIGAAMKLDENNAQAQYLLAQAEYLAGNYVLAEQGYKALLREQPAFKAKAELGLEYVYYQTNQYQKAQTLSGAHVSEAGLYDIMQAFGARVPYEVSWAGEPSTSIPFLVTDPLPIVALSVNGEMKNFLIDTGAGETYLNASVAEALGVIPIATQSGEYAGGIVVETVFGILDSLQLGSATLSSLPVQIASLDHFNTDDAAVRLDGIIGKGVFQQFCATMDYQNGALRLSPRGTRQHVHPDAVQVPFYMAGTHFMIAKSTVNGKPLQLFLDSGLDAPESLLLAEASLAYTDIQNIEMQPAYAYAEGGLGGAPSDIGVFQADAVQLGALAAVKNMGGLSGVFPESCYFNTEMGVFVDGIISHQFLRDYVWTIDYDAMMMTFAAK